MLSSPETVSVVTTKNTTTMKQNKNLAKAPRMDFLKMWSDPCQVAGLMAMSVGPLPVTGPCLL